MTGRHVRVLHVEDDRALAEAVAAHLGRARGWHVEHLATFAEAEARLTGDRFDAVILDRELPDGNGLDLLRVVRMHAPGTPVLLLTGRGDASTAMSAFALGALDYIQKGGDLQDLSERLDALLARSADAAQAARVTLVPQGAPRQRDEEAATHALDALPRGAHGAVFSRQGDVLATHLPPDVPAGALSALALGLHAQSSGLRHAAGFEARGWRYLAQGTEGLLVVQALRRHHVALLFPATPSPDALERVLASVGARLDGPP